MYAAHTYCHADFEETEKLAALHGRGHRSARFLTDSKNEYHSRPDQIILQQRDVKDKILEAKPDDILPCALWASGSCANEPSTPQNVYASDMCMCICVYVYLCVCLCVSVCMCGNLPDIDAWVSNYIDDGNSKWETDVCCVIGSEMACYWFRTERRSPRGTAAAELRDDRSRGEA